ncbi:hypothetical protein OAB00_03690 [Akkermansiaceae bacterium]|nr:hypothetical protein [Akkermansiaceae bacterium]
MSILLGFSLSSCSSDKDPEVLPPSTELQTEPATLPVIGVPLPSTSTSIGTDQEDIMMNNSTVSATQLPLDKITSKTPFVTATFGMG